MRANAMERLLQRFEDAVEELDHNNTFQEGVDVTMSISTLLNLRAKSIILRNRDDNRAASVIRELMNNGG